MDPAADRARVVEMWRALEFLSPQKIEKLAPRSDVNRAQRGRPLPWDRSHPVAGKPLRSDQAREHHVLLGVYNLEDLFAALEQVMPADADAYYDPPSGESAIGAMVVLDDGSLVASSASLSSCAWAVGRAHRPGHTHPDWLHGFDAAQAEFAIWLDEQLAAVDNEQAVDFELLARCRDRIVDLFGIADLLATTEIRVETREVQARSTGPDDSDQPPEPDFLNSFYLDDLSLVSSAVRRGDYGRALSDYLSPEREIDYANRIDIGERLDVAAEISQPARVPLGRWPANIAHPLALGQQIAVDAIVATLGPGSGLFAVNGPPGTGKTTLLRDLIAAIVVDRATKLATLERPEDAFVADGEFQWKTDGYPRRLQTWRPDLTPEGIVVASANNAAVENVSNEIPALEAIDPIWDSPDGYLRQIATNVLNAGTRGGDRPAWALIAARLGKMGNRTLFRSAFWFGPRPNRAGSASAAGMLDQFKDWQTNRRMDWTEEVARYRAALAEASADQQARSAIYGLWAAQPAAESHAHAARERAAATVAAHDNAQRRATEYGEVVGLWQQERDGRVRARAEHHQFRPNLVQAVFARKTWRSWHARDDDLAAGVDQAEQTLADAARSAAELAASAAWAEQDAAKAHQAAAAAAGRLAELQHRLATARSSSPGSVPTVEGWADPVGRERAAPWTDAEWNQSRTRLFLAALRLHEAFLACAATPMRKSLEAAMDVVAGQAPADLDEAKARQAWHALFFAVPVVSTTFASFDRLFSHMGREALGWLLIDEAGQAAPQVAAGAIWRARRVVCVGDPLQLEPIVNLPAYAQHTIRNHFGVDDRWLPDVSSVQSLADRVTPIGTHVRDGDDLLWVGAPLRVHRRCDNPMFTIANLIAYDGKMVHAVGPREELTLPDSAWLDVRSERSDGHWVPEQGARLEELLKDLAAEGQAFEQVFALSPFRAVARRLAKISTDYTGMTAGTVHRSQGREADVVILVLGGDPASPGAKRWAARKPNLVNVATTRAKRRLYVIGDRAAWAEHRYFDVLAAHLPTRVPDPGPPALELP